MISDAAKEVQVESHVLRYWEEELHLPIHRNELGHRYYTEEDVEKFKQIKSMKERGLQLKAIKMILKDGKIDIISDGKTAVDSSMKTLTERHGTHTACAMETEGTVLTAAGQAPSAEKAAQSGKMAIDIVASRDLPQQVSVEDREEKARRLQWLLQQMMRETLQENNKELSRDIKESVMKELDYQFRAQEEREEERERLRREKEDLHYQKLDELLRKKSRVLRKGLREQEKEEARQMQKLERERKKEEQAAKKAQTAQKEQIAKKAQIAPKEQITKKEYAVKKEQAAEKEETKNLREKKQEELQVRTITAESNMPKNRTAPPVKAVSKAVNRGKRKKHFRV